MSHTKFSVCEKVFLKFFYSLLESFVVFNEIVVIFNELDPKYDFLRVLFLAVDLYLYFKIFI